MSASKDVQKDTGFILNRNPKDLMVEIRLLVYKKHGGAQYVDLISGPREPTARELGDALVHLTWVTMKATRLPLVVLHNRIKAILWRSDTHLRKRSD